VGLSCDTCMLSRYNFHVHIRICDRHPSIIFVCTYFSDFIRRLFPDDLRAEKRGRPTTVSSKIRVSLIYSQRYFIGHITLIASILPASVWLRIKEVDGPLADSMGLHNSVSKVCLYRQIEQLYSYVYTMVNLLRSRFGTAEGNFSVR
jgi:hypothetical protein